MKWKVKDEADAVEEFLCRDTKGSYRHPVIKITPETGSPGYLTLLPPSRQPVSCEPVLTHNQRALER
jgi:hypothetical protein